MARGSGRLLEGVAGCSGYWICGTQETRASLGRAVYQMLVNSGVGVTKVIWYLYY